MIISFIKNFCKNISLYIAPRRCVLCRREIESSSLCEMCLSSLALAPRGSTHGIVHKNNIDDFVIGTPFSTNGIQELVHAIKYESREDCVPYIAEILLRELARRVNLLSKKQEVVLVPLPLHPRRLRERGFNQAELIAKYISEKTHVRYRTDIVTRKKYTTPQASLNGVERSSNISGAFSVCATVADELFFKSKITFIIVDDVITTGATANELAGTIKSIYKNATVVCATVAHE